MNMPRRELEPLIYRTISFEVSAFDRLKTYQRQLEAERGTPMTNSQVLAELLRMIPRPTTGH